MSKYEHSIFYTQSDDVIILLVVYEDYIVVTSSDSKGIMSLKVFQQTQFNTKDLGTVKYILGVEVIRSKKRIFLFQMKYVLDFLSEMRKLRDKTIQF